MSLTFPLPMYPCQKEKLLHTAGAPSRLRGSSFSEIYTPPNHWLGHIEIHVFEPMKNPQSLLYQETHCKTETILLTFLVQTPRQNFEDFSSKPFYLCHRIRVSQSASEKQNVTSTKYTLTNNQANKKRTRSRALAHLY